MSVNGRCGRVCFKSNLLKCLGTNVTNVTSDKPTNDTKVRRERGEIYCIYIHVQTLSHTFIFKSERLKGWIFWWPSLSAKYPHTLTNGQSCRQRRHRVLPAHQLYISCGNYTPHLLRFSYLQLLPKFLFHLLYVLRLSITFFFSLFLLFFCAACCFYPLRYFLYEFFRFNW